MKFEPFKQALALQGFACHISGMARPKRPRDPNQLAKLIVDMATGEAQEHILDDFQDKNPSAVKLGHLGGKKGGKARAAKLSSEQRSEIARMAAQARWSKNQD